MKTDWPQRLFDVAGALGTVVLLIVWPLIVPFRAWDAIRYWWWARQSFKGHPGPVPTALERMTDAHR